MPSWPWTLLPQHLTVLECMSAQVCPVRLEELPMTDDFFGWTAEVLHFDRNRRFASRAELAVVIVTPTPDRPFEGDGTRVLDARAQLDDSGKLAAN